jgi:hypothetical protein
MQKILLFTACFFVNYFLIAQATGTIHFEIDTNDGCFELESGFDAGAGHTIDGVNVHIASTSSGVALGDRANYPTVALDDSDGDGIYTLDYQPNGTSGNNEFRWYFDADVARPGMANVIVNEFLGNDFTDDAMPATAVWACKIRFAGGPVRTFFMNGPQDRKIRNALGKCLMCGDQEWNITMDMTPFSSAPADVTNLAFVPAANRHVSYNSSFPQLNMVNNGDNTFSLRIPMAAPEYIVHSFQVNFATTEASVLAPSTDVTSCDVFDFGSREYFEDASTDIKTENFLWASHGTVSPGGAVVPFAANSTVTADKAVTIGGVTYYLANNRQLLAVEWGAESIAPATDVSVTFGAAAAEWVANGTGFIATEGGGAAMMKRTWNVNATIATPVKVRFFFTQAEFDAVNALLGNIGGTAITGVDEMEFFKVTSGEDPQDISMLSPADVIIYDSGTASTTEFAENTEDRCPSGNDPSSTISIEHMVESFSGGGGGAASDGSALLPVELTALSASAVKSDVMVKWETASESFNQGFEVQHSIDGTTFSAIGMVAGAGSTSEYSNYGFEHINAPADLNYYRLKQMDYAGTFSYSNVVTAVVVDGNERMAIYPNPASSELFITTVGSGQVEVRNARGQLINKLNVTGEQQRLDISRLKSGLYFITLRDGDNTSTQRFMKK